MSSCFLRLSRPRAVAVAMFLPLLAALPGCRRSTEEVDPRMISAWVKALYGVFRVERLSPPVASRFSAYAGSALYAGMAAVHTSMTPLAELLPAAPVLPRIARPTDVDATIVAVAAERVVMDSLLVEGLATTRAQVARLADSLTTARMASGVSSEKQALSDSLGRTIGLAIVAWSRADGFTGTRGRPFTPPVGEGLWYNDAPGSIYSTQNLSGASESVEFDNPANQQRAGNTSDRGLILSRPKPASAKSLPAANMAGATEPYWSEVRPFVLKSWDACAVPDAPSYSTDTASALYRNARAVFDAKAALTDEQRTIAYYWADNAGESGTPVGHWLSIAGQMISERRLDAEAAVRLVFATSVSQADAFIASWGYKYRDNLLRPRMYIRRVIDPTWEPLLPTPPFPESPSGHSTQSAAAAAVITALIGASATHRQHQHLHRAFGAIVHVVPASQRGSGHVADLRRHSLSVGQRGRVDARSLHRRQGCDRVRCGRRRGNGPLRRHAQKLQALVASRAGIGAALVAMVAACSAPRDVSWHEEPGVRWRALEVSKGTPGFTALDGGKTGIRFQNNASEKILLGNRMLAQGAGVSLGDVDGDGLTDIFLARTEGCSALYRNEGNWHFEDITTRAHVGACNRHATGSALADVDGDGDLDLVLVTTTGPNAIFLNDGKARFTEHHDLGLDTVGRGATTITMADVAGDGRLALYITNYKAYSVDDTIPPQQRAFSQMVREVAPKQYEIVPEHRRDYKIVMRPDMGGMRMTQRAEPDEYYVNDGRGHFTRVPMTSGRFRDEQGAPVKEEFESFGFSARFVDFNGDGAPDLYVGNDFEDLDQLWLNDGAGNFKLAEWTAVRSMSNSAMGMDVADVNGDGRPDLFEVDMQANDARRLKTQMPTHTSLPKNPGDTPLQLQFQRNSLLINRGDGSFAEVSSAAGVQASGWSWGTMFMDVDLDGWQDILVANGHPWDIMDADIQEGLQNRLNDVQWQRQRWEFPQLKLRNVALRNRGDLTFEDATASWRFGMQEDISHGLASADLDGDGDLDVVINRLGAPALVMRNDATAARVSVRLIGDAPNTRAVGARVTLYDGAVPVQTNEVKVGGLYLSHSDYLLTFAMGRSDSARLEITWRDGRRTTIPHVRANREYEVSQKNAGAKAATDSTTVAGANAGPSLFVDATAQLRGHRHTENRFDDWDRQFLLPNALSQSGPGVSWFDVDRDGTEDLIVGTGKGGRVAVFRSVGGSLKPMPSSGPVAANDFTAVLGMTENGATRLLAGVATWELREERDMIAQPAAVRLAMSGASIAPVATAAVGSHESSTGPIALGDYNEDGALDLFVGSRALPMRYPLPATSGLFRNVNGAFVIDTANLAVLRNIGMVTSAMFADMNGDGHADLVLTRDWGSIALLLNDGRGRLQLAPDSWGLSRRTGQWNGVAAGDLDGDGRMDLVATNWGRNTGLEADSARPMVLTYGPFGAGGEVEMLLGRADARVKGLSPLNSYARVRMAVAGAVGRVNNFGAYADASVEMVLGASTAQSQRLEASTLDHVLFLNRGDRFEAVSLPAEAQWAPAFGAGIADFDGDGAEDVFLAQNFFPTMIGMPRYDAGRSLLLHGDGKGGLTPMAGQRSGLAVYGDQRGAAYADFNGDGRLDLAVSQNGDSTRLFVNRGATPGLRVRVRGGALNPDGVGVQMRLVYGTRMGPVREVQAGAGYWSQNGAVQVFGKSGEPTAVWVRWPGGATMNVPVAPGMREVVVTR